MTNIAATTGAQSVNRAIAVLRTVAALQRTGATLTGVVRMTGLNRTTAFRLLQCLVEERMVAFDEPSRTYRIGSLAIELGLAGGSFDHVAAPWRTSIRRIAERTGMTGYLIARSGFEAICIDSCQAPTAIRAVPLVPGQRLPLGIGAGSLAILASLPDVEVAAVLNANQTQRETQAARPVSCEELLGRIAEARETGYAYNAQTVAEGIIGLGIVIPPDDGVVHLAVSVSKIGAEMDEAERLRLATVICEELGIVSAPLHRDAA